MRSRAALLGIGLMLLAAPLSGQRVQFGLGAGLAYPGRDFGATVKLGTIALATVAYRVGESPVAIRVDGEYAELRGKPAATFVFPRHRVRALRLSAEYQYDGGDMESRLRAWAFGGIGAFYDEVDRGEPEIPPFGRTHPGVQLGIAAGYALGSLKPFGELGYQTILQSGRNTKFFALTVGFRVGGH
ncbi:MAG: hypothetical protein H0U85_09330 [Gemmatimonadales bacterium]|nr:hypothetical protein [Gemmatimonadales bacterium]